MTNKWTVKSVKEELPSVYVKQGKKVLRGSVGGRLNAYATVYLREEPLCLNGRWVYFLEYSWQAVTRSLNTETPLSL